MVERAVELIEPVEGGQVLIPVAQMVFAELAGGVALGLEQLGDGHVAGLEALRGAGQADFRVAGAQAALAGDERGATRRAALLGIVVREDHAFLGDAINVGRFEAHQSHRVGADVGLADVVAPDDDDVGFLALVAGLVAGDASSALAI